MTKDEEENAVRQLGEAIGYGRIIKVAEQIMRKKSAEIALYQPDQIDRLYEGEHN